MHSKCQLQQNTLKSLRFPSRFGSFSLFGRGGGGGEKNSLLQLGKLAGTGSDCQLQSEKMADSAALPQRECCRVWRKGFETEVLYVNEEKGSFAFDINPKPKLPYPKGLGLYELLILTHSLAVVLKSTIFIFLRLIY